MSTGAPELLGQPIDVLTGDESAGGPPRGQLVWRRLCEDRVAVVAMGAIAALILIAVFAPLIVKLVGARPPNDQSTKYLTSFGGATGPSAHNLFGTDDLGRDVFSRVVYGARVSLEVAVISTALIVAIGAAVGIVAGFYGGWVDTLLSRVTDIFLAFPLLLLALGLGAACSIGNGCIPVNYRNVGWVLIALGVLAAAATAALLFARSYREGDPAERRELCVRALPWGVLVVLGLAFETVTPPRTGGLIAPGLADVIFVIAIAGWPYVARIVRGQTLSLREQQFVEAARSIGASDLRILTRHILPNLTSALVVAVMVLIPGVVLFEAALSFLGVGVQPPTPSWGSMISQATEVFESAWWFMVFPGVALLICVLAFNLLGDGLQDALAGRRRGR